MKYFRTVKNLTKYSCLSFFGNDGISQPVTYNKVFTCWERAGHLALVRDV